MAVAGPLRWRDDHELLAAVAAHLHQQRVDGYPELVAAGKLSQRSADAGIRIMGAVARGWAAIVAIEPEPAGLHDPFQGGAHAWERVDTFIDRAIRARAIADAHPDDVETVGLADAIDTLLWWETASPSARWLVDMTIELRARAAADRAALSATAQPWRHAA